MQNPRIIFAGTPDFAATIFESVLNKYHVVAAYTQPDRPAGRGKKPTPSPVKQLAIEHKVPVEQPLDFKEPESLERLKDYKADLMIVVAYGLILPMRILQTPKLGCLNVHASLLPRWRGAAPIQRAIEAGDTNTGISIMQMDQGLDTGAVWAEEVLPIPTNATGTSLHDELATLGAKLLLETLPEVFEQDRAPKPQNEDGATYAKKLTKAEAEIDWRLSAEQIERKVRAYNSWPVAFFKIDDRSIRVWTCETVDIGTSKQPGSIIQSDKNGIVVACGAGATRLLELQPAGSRRMLARDLLNSKAEWFSPGNQLGTLD